MHFDRLYYVPLLAILFSFELRGQTSCAFELGNDTTLCAGQELQLTAPPDLIQYDWSTGATTPQITVADAGTYSLTTATFGDPSDDLVVNGDFEAGAEAFTSDYNLAVIPGPSGLLTNAGLYVVTTDPALTHSAFASCGDHTTGTGNMLVVNGSEVPDANVWCQTVDVQPNTGYAFTAWLMSVIAVEPAHLEFTINGVSIGEPLLASATTCQWEQFHAIWESGTATTAELCLTNQNTAAAGNDFAIDDISFIPLCINNANITVDIQQPPPVPAAVADDLICPGTTTLLDATTPQATYAWSTGETTPTITVGPGTYSVDIVVNECTTTASATIGEHEVLQGFLGNDTTMCAGEELVLGPIPGSAVQEWQDGSTGATFLVNAPGIFTATITDLNGCPADDAIEVVYAPAIMVDLGPDVPICEGEEILLDASWPDAHHEWATGETSPTLLVTTTGTYVVEVSQGFCSVKDSVHVEVLPLPIFSLGSDTIICPGELVILQMDPEYPDASLTWSTGATQPAITVSQAGLYVLVADLNGCTSQDEVEVTVTPLPSIDLGSDLILCTGDSAILDIAPGDASVTWSNGETGSTITVHEADTYWVVLELDECIGGDTIEVEVYDHILSLDLGGDRALCAGDTIFLEATQPRAGSYLWNTGGSDPVLAVTVPGTYAVHVLGACMDASDEVIVIDEDCAPISFAPNAFTPDGDGVNDVFHVVIDEDLLEYRLEIFDRWGIPVFSSTDPYAGWDGTIGGRPAQDGVYVYELYYRSARPAGSAGQHRRGHITLVR